MQRFLIGFISATILFNFSSCKSNKIPCPTYADSQPESKKKKGKPEPEIPKATKPKSGVLPPNYGKKKK